jgi:hypothetical protein
MRLAAERRDALPASTLWATAMKNKQAAQDVVSDAFTPEKYDGGLHKIVTIVRSFLCSNRYR